MAQPLLNIAIVGSGNVASHLAVGFYKVGVKINMVINRTIDHAKELALKVEANYSNTLSDIPENTDLVIIAVTDSAIEGVSKAISSTAYGVVHVSGSMPLSVLSANTNYGVFYPFQTFSKSERTGALEFPICIEANSEELKQKLSRLAGKLSKTIVYLSSEDRKYLHLSGVIANNFTNHLMARAYDYLNEHNISADLINPIIEETINKIKNNHPKDVQTGPAVRGNSDIVKNHLALLNNYPQLLEIYQVMTNSINAYYKTDEE
jgi:predicted short-subunit dehydrogenase-like oxidoreductase (DUF2520 family)